MVRLGRRPVSQGRVRPVLVVIRHPDSDLLPGLGPGLRRGGVEQRCDGLRKQPGLEFTLQEFWKGAAPEKYRDRVELRGALANLNLEALPDHLIARLAAGENPLGVLASAAEEGYELLRLAPGSAETGEG